MKSPFPGMDPFMELRWRDLHNRLIAYIGDQLQEELPKDLRAQIGERVLMEVGDAAGELALPETYLDLSVLESSRGGAAVAENVDVDRALAVPDLIVEDDSLPESETNIEIVDAETGLKIITVVELLSPTNKLSGKGRESYLAKQSSYLRAGIHLVEIDLTRHGDRRAVMAHLMNDLGLPHPAYLAVVHRSYKSKRKSKREYYQLPMEKALKPIAVPLRPTDEDVILRLQPLLELAYQRGRYYDLDYSQRLNPPLSFAEQAFLEQCLAKRQ
jgi:hypothetical protein